MKSNTWKMSQTIRNTTRDITDGPLLIKKARAMLKKTSTNLKIFDILLI